ncbi:hypothetical protein PCLA_04f0604 [Pseudomonas citronellolis]|nr:hypothetical protein PCLA_04f0604 [Pseudomonas citronellolis]
MQDVAHGDLRGDCANINCIFYLGNLLLRARCAARTVPDGLKTAKQRSSRRNSAWLSSAKPR